MNIRNIWAAVVFFVVASIAVPVLTQASTTRYACVKSTVKIPEMVRSDEALEEARTNIHKVADAVDSKEDLMQYVAARRAFFDSFWEDDHMEFNPRTVHLMSVLTKGELKRLLEYAGILGAMSTQMRLNFKPVLEKAHDDWSQLWDDYIYNYLSIQTLQRKLPGLIEYLKE